MTLLEVMLARVQDLENFEDVLSQSVTVHIQRSEASQVPDHLQDVLPDNQHHLVAPAQPQQVSIWLLEQKILVHASRNVVRDDERVINVKHNIESFGHILVYQPFETLLVDSLVD